MWLLVITLWVQNGLDVTLVNVLTVRFDSATTATPEADCRARAIRENGPVPLQPGNSARWQSAECVQVRS